MHDLEYEAREPRRRWRERWWFPVLVAFFLPILFIVALTLVIAAFIALAVPRLGP